MFPKKMRNLVFAFLLFSAFLENFTTAENSALKSCKSKNTKDRIFYRGSVSDCHNLVKNSQGSRRDQKQTIEGEISKKRINHRRDEFSESLIINNSYGESPTAKRTKSRTPCKAGKNFEGKTYRNIETCGSCYTFASAAIESTLMS